MKKMLTALACVCVVASSNTMVVQPNGDHDSFFFRWFSNVEQREETTSLLPTILNSYTITAIIAAISCIILEK